MKKLIIFHPYLAPYRIDFFNYLSNYFELKVYFQYINDPAQPFNLSILNNRVHFKYEFILEGFKIFGRQIRFKIWRIIKNEKPDIIITHEFAFISISVLAYKAIHFKNFKHVVTTDDSLSILKQLRLHRKIAKSLVLGNINGLITTNTKSLDWHMLKYPQLISKIIDMPIIQDENRFRNNLERAIPLSKKYIDIYGLRGKKIILYVGRFVKEKGVKELVGHFIKINDPNACLILVGDGNLKQEIIDKIKLHNEKRIILPGRFDGLDLLAWYNVASYFILPSNFEPFGAVINESLLSGLFVICSRYAGASELIYDNLNGQIFDPKNDLEFPSMLSRIISETNPINSNNLLVKSNLMNISFSEKMDRLIKKLNNL